MKNLRIPRSFKEKDIRRSIWDLGSPIQTTFKQCLQTPMHFEIMKPTDRFTIDYATLIQSMPMNNQLISDWKLRISCFSSDLSNYYSWMDNNSRLTTEEIKNRKHHRLSCYRYTGIRQTEFVDKISRIMYPSFADNPNEFGIIKTFMSSALPSFVQGDVGSRSTLFTPDWVKVFGVQSESLLDFVGFPAGFAPSYFANTSVVDVPEDLGRSFNADYLLVYLDVIRNYCVNNQLDSVPYFCALPVVNVNRYEYLNYEIADYSPFYGSIPLEEIDNFFKLLRCESDGVDIYDFCIRKGFDNLVDWLTVSRYGGLFLCQYERDMLNGLLRKVDTSDVEIQVDPETGTFTINAFRFKNRDQLFNDRLDVSGGRWNNVLRAIWGAKGSKRMDIPQIIGTTSYTISPQGIKSTSDTSSQGGADIGQIASVTNSFDSNRFKHSVYAEDHCILFIMASLVPQVTYVNGLGKGLDIINFADEYYPQYDQLGFQDVPMYKYNCKPRLNMSSTPSNGILQIVDSGTPSPFKKVVGKNIAFIDLISNVGRLHGKFGHDALFESWVLKREFEQDVLYERENGVDSVEVVPGSTPVLDITSYADPMLYQYPFVTTGLTDSNFVLQLGLEIKANRPKGKRYMPTLGK